MEKKEISDRIKNVLVEDLFVADSVSEVGDKDELGTDLGMDSVGFVELATIVGEIFEIKVNDTDVGEGHFQTVEKLTDFVHSRVHAQSATADA